MTLAERRKPQIINGSRRQRIANGSGTRPQDVSTLIKQFDMMRKMLRQQLGALPTEPGMRSSRKARRGMPKVRGF